MIIRGVRCAAIIVLSVITITGYAQRDSTQRLNVISESRTPSYSGLIIPITILGVGVIGLESDWLKFQNREINRKLHENIDRRISIDDFSQYAPMAAVYGLGVLGVKGRHNLRDKSVILAISYLIMGTSVNIIKSTTRVMRPDESAFNSFPSGHTATAFMGAEFLWQEYKDVSPWIGVAGYTVATATGFFRMYNNRHWMTDVLAGAGIGMLSTKIAYWVYPSISKNIFKSHSPNHLAVLPYYTASSGFGASAMLLF